MIKQQQLSAIDILSVLCFCLTLQTMDDTKILEMQLEEQGKDIKKILEVLKNDN